MVWLVLQYLWYRSFFSFFQHHNGNWKEIYALQCSGNVFPLLLDILCHNPPQNIHTEIHKENTNHIILEYILVAESFVTIGFFSAKAAKYES